MQKEQQSQARAAAEALEFHQVELRLQLEIEQQKVFQVQGQPPVQCQQVFNVPTASKLVFRWDGKSDLDMYFEVFEKTALVNQWPVEHWSVLIRTQMVGKAQDVFTEIADDHLTNYAILKAALLTVFEVVPEKNRTRFRTLQKM